MEALDAYRSCACRWGTCCPTLRKFGLLEDWQRVARRAWSVRFSLLAAGFTAAEVVVPLFGEVLPRGLFVLLAFGASLGAVVARLLAQPEMHP